MQETILADHEQQYHSSPSSAAHIADSLNSEEQLIWVLILVFMAVREECHTQWGLVFVTGGWPIYLPVGTITQEDCLSNRNNGGSAVDASSYLGSAPPGKGVSLGEGSHAESRLSPAESCPPPCAPSGPGSQEASSSAETPTRLETRIHYQANYQYLTTQNITKLISKHDSGHKERPGVGRVSWEGGKGSLRFSMILPDRG